MTIPSFARSAERRLSFCNPEKGYAVLRRLAYDPRKQELVEVCQRVPLSLLDTNSKRPNRLGYSYVVRKGPLKPKHDRACFHTCQRHHLDGWSRGFPWGRFPWGRCFDYGHKNLLGKGA